MKKKENQYAVIARKAYQLIIDGEKNFEKAWEKAGKNNGAKENIIKKPCPKHAFIGLCESGDLKGIHGKVESVNINYQYAKYAIKVWRNNAGMSSAEVWEKVKTHFGKAINHNRQLDVVKGLWEFIK